MGTFLSLIGPGVFLLPFLVCACDVSGTLNQLPHFLASIFFASLLGGLQLELKKKPAKEQKFLDTIFAIFRLQRFRITCQIGLILKT